jgi:hypothetical protein
MPQTFPNMPNFRMPNLQGIGGIPGLQNIDFSNLPMGMDLVTLILELSMLILKAFKI